MLRFLLLYKIEWTDRHPGPMLVCAMAIAMAGAVLSKVTA
jgi:hypothetical protein